MVLQAGWHLRDDPGQVVDKRRKVLSIEPGTIADSGQDLGALEAS